MLTEAYDPDFRKATSIVFGVSKFLGVYPPERSPPCSQVLKAIPVLVQFLSMVYSGYLWLKEPGVSPWVPTSTGWYYKVLPFLPFVAGLIYNSLSFFLFGNRLFKIFRELHGIEKGINSLHGISIAYPNTSRSSKVFLSLILMKMFNNCSRETCWSSSWSLIDYVILVPDVMNILALLAIMTQFTSIVHVLEDQVNALSKILDERIRPMKDEELEEILRLFNRMYNTCSGVNSVYSVQILAIITLDYVNVNVSAYRIVTFFSWVFDEDETHTQSFFSLLVDLTGFLQSIVVLVLVVEACSALQTAVTNFNKSLYRLALDGDNQELQFNELLGVHFSMGQTPSFTACGFFYLNYEMMYSVCASNVMFIVLALQML